MLEISHEDKHLYTITEPKALVNSLILSRLNCYNPNFIKVLMYNNIKNELFQII